MTGIVENQGETTKHTKYTNETVVPACWYRVFFVYFVCFVVKNSVEEESALRFALGGIVGFPVPITGPMIGERPSWGFLGLLGLIGGGPTFLGTLIGYQVTSDAVSVLFLALAAGAILYVVGELQHAGRKIGAHDVAMLGLLLGFLVAYGTDLLLHVAGA